MNKNIRYKKFCGRAQLFINFFDRPMEKFLKKFWISM